jgi:hypothetical protein
MDVGKQEVMPWTGSNFRVARHLDQSREAPVIGCNRDHFKETYDWFVIFESKSGYRISGRRIGQTQLFEVRSEVFDHPDVVVARDHRT